MSVNVKFSINWKEYYRADRFLRRHDKGQTPDKFIGVALMILGTALSMAGVSWPYPLLAVIIGLGLLFGPSLRRRFEIKRRWAREPIYTVEHVASCSDQGI